MSAPGQSGGRAWLLFVEHRPMLRAFIRSFVNQPSDAEDVLQEVGITVLEIQDALKDERNFGAWARSIARNHVLRYWRTRRRSRETPTASYFDVVEQVYARADDEPAHWKARYAALNECLSRMDGESRDLLAMRYAHELTSDAIAARQGRSAAAVRKTLERLRVALHKCVERRLRSEGEA
jgi:RNA polymerase sigma-70 factor (ECF subfamily)